MVAGADDVAGLLTAAEVLGHSPICRRGSMPTP
jgi:hypothetical protein